MKYDQPSFKRIENSYYNFLKKQEVLGEPFYDKLGQLNNFYLPICESIFQNYLKKKTNNIDRSFWRARVRQVYYC